jgi:hypothetical protein
MIVGKCRRKQAKESIALKHGTSRLISKYLPENITKGIALTDKFGVCRTVVPTDGMWWSPDLC